MKRIITLILLFFSLQAFSQTYEGTIIRVIDGDTYVFQTQEGSFKVRMDGIDAPESDQAYGKESTLFMEAYLNKPGTLKSSGVDRYGRILGTLFIENKNINLESVKTGNAWHYKKYSSDTELNNAEVYARENKLGLWKNPAPIEPWEWRKK